MATINRVVLVGNLTRDPELRTSTGGTSICRLRVACNAIRRNRDTGEVDERPNFFDVTVFGASGDACARFLTKGRAVAVDGRLEWSEWQTSEGETRQAVGVIAESLQFLGPRPDSENEAVEAEREEVVAF
jgi:single-strand DNA-binding protein